MSKFESIYNEALAATQGVSSTNPAQVSTGTNTTNVFTQKLTPKEIDEIKNNIRTNITKVNNADQLISMLFGSDNTQTAPQQTSTPPVQKPTIPTTPTTGATNKLAI